MISSATQELKLVEKPLFADWIMPYDSAISIPAIAQRQSNHLLPGSHRQSTIRPFLLGFFSEIWCRFQN